MYKIKPADGGAFIRGEFEFYIKNTTDKYYWPLTSDRHVHRC